jgi:UDP-3-O-[3-hydroxymyristoyl] glucosamine N-acyltransferase
MGMTVASTPPYKLCDLVDGLEVTIQGDPNCLIENVSTIHQSKPGSITFLTNPAYRKYLATTQASAIILTEEDGKDFVGNAVICQQPYYVYAKIANYFVKKINQTKGVHATAVVGEHCQIDPTATIAPNCVIGDRVQIAANVRIGPGTIIGNEVTIKANTQLDAHVVIYDQVEIGERVRISSGAVIGSDGFGFANYLGAWHKVPQLGSVVIGDDVDIGANTMIDRGAIDHTVIEDGVKLDNHIQIGHNVRVGAHTIIAGCVGIAGSTVIGKHCMIGGASILVGHITLADHVVITGGTGVSKSIHEPGVYSSGVVGAIPNHEFRKNNARFYRLDKLFDRVKALELAVKSYEEKMDG